MPKAAKKFRLHDKPSAPAQRVMGGASHNYGRAWVKFRAWYASVVPPVCVGVLPGGKVRGKALPSRQMHLGHEPPLTGPEDDGLLDPDRVQWLCLTCHSRKTALECGFTCAG